MELQGDFPSGRVCGMTQLPPCTVRRYVTQFREHFSPQARVKSNGRRFTPKDIELLLQIRNLYNNGYTTPAVHKALDGNWQSNTAPRKDVGDAIKIVQEARDELETVKHLVKRFESRLDEAELNDRTYSEIFRELGEEIEKIKLSLQIRDANPSLLDRFLGR